MQSDLENHKWLTWCFLALLSLLVAGCVRPDVATETGTPGGEIAGVPTMPTTSGGVGITPPPTHVTVNANAVQIQQYFQANLGFTPNNVQVLGRLNLPSGLDALDIFIYQNESGQRCAGIIQISGANILVGDSRCSADGKTVAGAILFQPLQSPTVSVALYAYVDLALEPGASVVAVEFPTEAINQNLTQGGFIINRPGLDFPRQVIFINQGGNTVSIVPIQ